VRALGSVRLFDRCFALDVLTRDDAGERRAAGVLTWHPRFGLQIVWARAVVLACGGAGQVYRETTNPKVATGDAVAMAWRAGVTVADLEFMQFHPTSLYVAGAPRHLISEAVRGEGAWLVDASGERFMHGVHPMAELAPRDIVSRGIVEHLARTGQSHAFLDCRHLGGGEPGFFARRFPGLDRMLAGFGLDASRELIPVNPAAHYTIGGVLTDLSGRTSLRGLYACGESASNGVHGANRLASNSLLDGLVFGRRVAHALAADALPDPVPVHTDSRIDVPERGDLDVADIRASLRSAMWRNVGVQRSATRLGDVLKMIEFWGRYGLHAVFERPSGWEAQNLLTVAHLMARAALERTESRGTHWRSDAPEPSPAWRVRLAWTPGRDQPDRLPIPLEARA
jgi:L-aspartate oxidase